MSGQKDYHLLIANTSLKDNNSTLFVEISNAKGKVESIKIIMNVTPFSGQSIQRASMPPQIDAEQEKIWDNVQPIALKNHVFGEINSDTDLSAWIKLLWDEKNLYLWAQITDDVISNKDNKNNEQDGLEIYLDTNNNKPRTYGENEYHLRYMRNESAVVAIQNKPDIEIKASQKNVKNGYQMELAIPWAAIHGKPSIGQFIGIDVHVIDNDNDSHNSKIAWNATQDFARRSPMFWGTMKLAE